MRVFGAYLSLDDMNTDTDLMNTDTDLYTRLIRDAQPRLLREINKLILHHADAQDVLQETLLSIWAAQSRFDPEQPFYPWARRIAVNKIFEFSRKERLTRFFYNELLKFSDVRDCEGEGGVESGDTLLNCLVTCLYRLPLEEQELLLSFYAADVAAAALAQRFECSREAIYKRIHRARDTLRALMASCGCLQSEPS